MGLHDHPRGIASGDELDYKERTTPLTVTPTSDSTAASFIDGNEIVVDGNTRICIEFHTPYVDKVTNGEQLILNLWEDSNDRGRIGYLFTALSGEIEMSMLVRRFLTPAAGRHTYHIKAWKSGGTVVIGAGAGGTATYMPAYMRITRA